MEIDKREKRQHAQPKYGDQRQPFQIDRDRLIYSRAFRRLAQVTQVASASEGSVFHNRLTHSLKVAQVGRRLAEKLSKDTLVSNPTLLAKCGGLDPDVVEAAALAHDLGHPPFGHIAEKELDKLAKEHGLVDGFEGNAQTFRILTELEPNRPEYPGLDLTRATLNATLKYPWFRARNCDDVKTNKRTKKYSVYDIDREAFEFVRQPLEAGIENDQQTLEASIMDFADDVTYSVHDFEDFYLADLIPVNTLTYNQDEFDKFINEWLDTLPDNSIKEQVVTLEEQRRLKRLLELYLSQHQPSSIEHIAYIRRLSSELIQQYIQSVFVKEDYGEYGYLQRQTSKEIELQFFQQIVKKYVIFNPRLTTQQYGQREIMKRLFSVYLEAIENKQVNLISSRFLKNGSLERLHMENEGNQKVRTAVDIVASFSELEAIVMYRRFSGIEQGSVMDYIV
jgi:dGTPase